jgi:hypothetical protein
VQVDRDAKGRPLCRLRRAERYKGRLIEFRFASVNGRLVCCGLQIGPSLVSSTEPKKLAFDYPFGTAIHSEGVDTTEQRVQERENDLLPLHSQELRIPLADLVDQVLEGTIQFLELGREEGWSEQTERYVAERLPAAQAGRTKKRGRKPVYGDEHYRQVAKVYEDRYRSGHRDPLRAVMRWAARKPPQGLGRKIEKSTAASWVRTAREKQFLKVDYWGDNAG